MAQSLNILTNSWTGINEAELNGVGLNWNFPKGGAQLVYRKGGILWSNASFDLDAKASYQIDNTVVLSANSLGDTVIKSNLRSVGTLEKLVVEGDVTLANFVQFNSQFGRIGVGTQDPNLAIDIIENNVEIVIGSPKTSFAHIGTLSNHDLGIITDGIPRITVKNDGEVIIGDAVNKTGSLRVYGSLHVDNLVTDTRIDRSSPLQFQAPYGGSVYGLGISWIGSGNNKQLIMRDGPDRLWTNEAMDIGADRSYYINGQPVVSERALGAGIVFSNLTTLGVLSELTVSGPATVAGDLTMPQGSIRTNSILINDGVKSLQVTNLGIATNGTVQIAAHGVNVIKSDAGGIEIGDKANIRKPVKVFGPLSVGVNNPDPTLGLSVKGDVSINDKRFTNGFTTPTQGTFELGDICWNSNPQGGNYIGWVCVRPGSPGEWLPFGAIGNQ